METKQENKEAQNKEHLDIKWFIQVFIITFILSIVFKFNISNYNFNSSNWNRNIF